MSCEHYWREGILLVERGEPDPHRDTCAACRREHTARDEIIRALPLVGAWSAGDPTWQARVWRRIARLEARRTRQRWYLGGGFAAAFAVLLMCWAIHIWDTHHELRPQITVVPSEVAMRSASPRVGDRIHITVKPSDEVRIYLADRLALRCRAGFNNGGCLSDSRQVIADALLTIEGAYLIVIITAATAEPVGSLDRDLAAVASAGGDYQITELSVQ